MPLPDSGAMNAFHGTIIHSITPTDLELVENGLLVVSTEGRIVIFERNVPHSHLPGILIGYGFRLSDISVRFLDPEQFLIPGFIDTHNHAPQFTQRGVGRGIPLLSWLKDVTFAHEARFQDPAYARHTYVSAVDTFLRQGITTASYYGSLHAEATKILADVCLEKGQRALIGKCNMDQNAVDFYCEQSAEDSLSITEDVISYVRNCDPNGKLVQPVLTPRFAITCSRSLLSGLGKIASNDPVLMIQTHFNEAPDEIAFTRKLFPEFSTETELYSHFKLLNSNTILAHVIFSTPTELQTLSSLNVGVAHCPISNVTVPTFMAAPIRQMLSLGMKKIGLGTDSGGGFSSSILDAMRQAFIVSNSRQTYHSPKDAYSQFRATGGIPHVQDAPALSSNPVVPAAKHISSETETESPLTLAECFYLATLGGASVCNLDHKVGNFAVGKEFDALIIDMPRLDPQAKGEVNDKANQTNDSEAYENFRTIDISPAKDATSTPIELEVDDPLVIWEKFLMTGDDRNIVHVFIGGRQVK